MVASKRLPASFFRPASIGWPLYQSRAMPEIELPVVEQDTRADALIENVAPDGTAVDALSASATVSRKALPNALPPGFTLESVPVPTVAPFTSTSALTSYLRFRLLPFWPTQSLAGLNAVSCLTGALTVVP